MAQYTFDPTQGKVVPLAQAKVVTYITNDPGGMPDEQTRKAAAAEAVTAAQGAGIATKSGGGGFTDSQNAARLQAENQTRLTALGGATTDSQNAARLEAEAAVNTDEEIIEEVDLVEDPNDDIPDEGDEDLIDDGSGNAPARYNLGGSDNPPLGGRTVVSTYIDAATGDTYAIYSDGTKTLLSKGTRSADAAAATAKEKLEAEQAAAIAAAEKKSKGQSAYDLLVSEFDRFGLGSLIADVEKYIKDGLSKDELTLKLRSESTAYKTRFAANTKRLAKGLRALSEAEYISTEDQYQDVMRRYGMPESYYAKGDLGVQVGFEKFLEGDVSAVELEDRIQTAQNRVVNSNPEVAKALKEFYPGISNGDILSYVLDPTNAIEQIKRKVTAAEIGGAAIQAGIGYKGNTPEAIRARSEELAAAGVTKAVAQQGFETIAGGAPRGGQLASIYGQDPYTQTTAETEVFGLSGKTAAATQRKKITGLEKATFGGQSGATSSALVRDKAGGY